MLNIIFELLINFPIYPYIYPYIGVRVYPYGIFDPWAHWDAAWLGWENSSATAAVVAVAHPLG